MSATVTINDSENVLSSLQNGEPITMRDATLQPISSQERKKTLANIAHVEAQLGRLARTMRDIRAAVLNLTVDE